MNLQFQLQLLVMDGVVGDNKTFGQLMIRGVEANECVSETILSAVKELIL